MGKLIDGKSIAKKIREKTAQRVALLKEQGITPKLAVVLVGKDLPSQTYVKKKGQAAEKVGMNFDLYELPENISKQNIINKIDEIQNDPELSGLIVQLPLPEPLYTTDVLNAIRPEFDVDCLTDINLGKLVMKTNYIVPPTPGAVMSILHDLDIDLVGKNVTIIGMGALVGKPLAIMMANERASVSTCNSKTRDTKEKCLSADIIVTGVGRKDILRGDMVSDGAIVIDTGVSFEDGKMYGDVNVAEILEHADYVTPTPGGVGPITVARLLWNTIICAERSNDPNLRINPDIQIVTDNSTDKDKTKLLHADLSYEINGILFAVHNEIGKYANEKQVCDRIESYFKDKGMTYQREFIIPKGFEEEKTGRNRIDFYIEDKIALEVKCKRFIEKEDYYQLQRYLSALDKDLGILVNFRDDKLKPRRILNPNRK